MQSGENLKRLGDCFWPPNQGFPSLAYVTVKLSFIHSTERPAIIFSMGQRGWLVYTSHLGTPWCWYPFSPAWLRRLSYPHGTWSCHQAPKHVASRHRYVCVHTGHPGGPVTPTGPMDPASPASPGFPGVPFCPCRPGSPYGVGKNISRWEKSGCTSAFHKGRKEHFHLQAHKEMRMAEIPFFLAKTVGRGMAGSGLSEPLPMLR